MNFWAKATTKELMVKLDFSNKRELHDFLLADQEKGYKGNYFVTIERETKKRSPEQNNALHLFFELLTNALNEAGYTVKKVLEQKIDIDWTPRLVKELLWRPAQEVITNKKSTTDLDKASEISIVYDHINRHIGEKFGIHVPFPDKSLLPKKDMPEYPENNLEAKF